MNFKVLVDLDLAFEMPDDPGSKKKILAFMRSLSAEPVAKADFFELDPDSAIIYTKIIDDKAVSYLVDSEKMEVSVEFIRPADS